MKARSEGMLARGGLSEREVKRGRGGIRDIEFAVQLLQFVHGRHDTGIRSPTTLDALDQLARYGYIDGADGEHLSVAYRYLRTVEHRLQLEREQQVYALPADPVALGRLARVLGYRDTPDATALEQFETTHRRHQASARSIHERLFFRPLLEALAGSRPLGREQVADQLSAFGFRDLAATQSAVEELTIGMSRTAIQLRVLFPRMLEWLSASPNPDLGLLQLRIVLDGPVRASTVVPAIRESPLAAERLCWVLGCSKVVGQGLRRHPELVADLGNDALIAAPKPAALLAAEAEETLSWRGDARTGREEGIRRFKRREETRIACRDLLGLAPGDGVAAELTALADATVEAELAALAPPFPFAVIGMGKLGGGELAYPSDLDVVFVHTGPQHEAEAIATALLAEIGGSTPEGRAWEIDARLRPEGNQGVLARSLASYAEYYERWGQVWERQALIKARFVAGDAELGKRFGELRDRIAYGRGLDDAELAELRHIKGRVERERIRGGDDPAYHLKLGPGGMVDVEFTVQLLQLCHGWEAPTVRTPGTLEGLARLVDTGLVDGDEAAVLRSAYEYCERLRNAWYLRTAAKRDTVPRGEAEQRDLGRLLRVADVAGEYHRRATAARSVVERLFYGRTG
jgi:glutamate-ammonia-ligase adenylyltransferase